MRHMIVMCRYPVPPSKENNAKTERIIGNWMKARGNRKQVCTTGLLGICY